MCMLAAGMPGMHPSLSGGQPAGAKTRSTPCVRRRGGLTARARAQVYYVYGFMLLVFLILAIVTVCVTIVGTYFLLNAENYHWQWTSFCAAASTALCAFSGSPRLPCALGSLVFCSPAPGQP